MEEKKKRSSIFRGKLLLPFKKTPHRKESDQLPIAPRDVSAGDHYTQVITGSAAKKQRIILMPGESIEIKKIPCPEDMPEYADKEVMLAQKVPRSKHRNIPDSTVIKATIDTRASKPDVKEIMFYREPTSVRSFIDVAIQTEVTEPLREGYSASTSAESISPYGSTCNEPTCPVAPVEYPCEEGHIHLYDPRDEKHEAAPPTYICTRGHEHEEEVDLEQFYICDKGHEHKEKPESVYGEQTFICEDGHVHDEGLQKPASPTSIALAEQVSVSSVWAEKFICEQGHVHNMEAFVCDEAHMHHAEQLMEPAKEEETSVCDKAHVHHAEQLMELAQEEEPFICDKAHMHHAEQLMELAQEEVPFICDKAHMHHAEQLMEPVKEKEAYMWTQGHLHGTVIPEEPKPVKQMRHVDISITPEIIPQEVEDETVEIDQEAIGDTFRSPGAKELPTATEVWKPSQPPPQVSQSKPILDFPTVLHTYPPPYTVAPPAVYTCRTEGTPLMHCSIQPGKPIELSPSSETARYHSVYVGTPPSYHHIPDGSSYGQMGTRYYPSYDTQSPYLSNYRHAEIGQAQYPHSYPVTTTACQYQTSYVSQAPSLRQASSKGSIKYAYEVSQASPIETQSPKTISTCKEMSCIARIPSEIISCIPPSEGMNPGSYKFTATSQEIHKSQPTLQTVSEVSKPQGTEKVCRGNFVTTVKVSGQ